MPTPKRSLPGLWWTPVTLGVILLALAGGWWLGQRQSRIVPMEDPKRAVLAREATQLRLRLDRNEGSDVDRQRLLELLVGLERKGEAIALLEPMADREPERWSLRLMLAELRRNQGDRSGAERELRQILSRNPRQVEALQLLSLLKLEQGRGSEAEALVKAAYGAASAPAIQPEAMGLGLLLAELQQKRGAPALAEATYRQLGVQFPQDQRPLMGLALQRHDRGDAKGAQEALAQARLRSPEPERPDPRLDRLAASWGLAPLRAPASGRIPAKPAPPDGATIAPRSP
jgi:tetratricopeptide (TPR) repeat protein